MKRQSCAQGSAPESLALPSPSELAHRQGGVSEQELTTPRAARTDMRAAAERLWKVIAMALRFAGW